MSKITYFLYCYPNGDPYGINACTDGEDGKLPCAFMNFRQRDFEAAFYTPVNSGWKLPGTGNSMHGIRLWVKGRGINGRFIRVCEVRRLFKEHRLDLTPVPPPREEN